MKAIALFSGGLDSLLAIKLIQSQNINVTAVSFTSHFYINSEEKKRKLKKVAKENNFKIKFIEFKEDYLKLIKKPKHGYGKNINPCIDCHAFMLKKAKQLQKQLNAKFIFTGEVLDERPMSQNKSSLKIVETESGLKGRLLRPLSAKLLKETEAEKKKYVNRDKLLAIRGRGRKSQFELAKTYNIKEFETPAGGCLLTDQNYSNKLKDLLKHKELSFEKIKLLRTGRHFRFKKNKIIVGRNEKENNIINKYNALKFEAKDYVGPTTILTGKPTKTSIELAASLTARYSDAKEDKVRVKYGKTKLNRTITVNKIEDKYIEKMRI